MDSIFSFIEHYKILLGSFPLVIQIAIVVIALNVMVTLSLFSITFFMRRKRESEDRMIKKYRPKVEALILDVLNSNEIYSEQEIDNLYFDKISKLSKKSYITIIPVMEDLVHKTPSLMNSKNYKALIRGLKIDEFLEKRISYSNTNKRMRAFQTLSRLNITVSDSKILPHTYSNDDRLRKESRTSYVGISKNDPFKFFDKGNTNLNYWDQIALLKQFEAHHGDNLPNFSKWIKYSDDNSQIIFLVRAVTYFNQVESADVLVDLLKTDNHKVRKVAIIALGRMGIVSAEEELKKIYHTQPIDCQDAIIEAIAYIGSGNSLEFLKKAFFDANNPDAKRLVAEAIYIYGEEGKKCFEELSASCTVCDDFSHLIFEHVRNPLIPSALKGLVVRQKEKELDVILS